MFAPLSGKITLVADQNLANAGAFGVLKGTFNEITKIFTTLGNNLRYEFGGFIKIAYHGKLTKDLSLDTKLELFSNYGENPQNIDVNWEMMAAVKISKWFSVNMKNQLVYDDDVKTRVNADGKVLEGAKIQFHEILGVGFTMKF
jgi:hypothetical protein